MKWNRELALEQVDGDEELLDEILDLYKETSQTDLQDLHSALTNNDPVKLGKSAHNLRGASAALGLEEIVQLCEELEQLARIFTGQKGPIAPQKFKLILADIEQALNIIKEH